MDINKVIITACLKHCHNVDAVLARHLMIPDCIVVITVTSIRDPQHRASTCSH